MDKKRLIIVLDKHGWTQTKIAERLNLSVARICQIITEYNNKRSLDPIRCEICDNPLPHGYLIEIEEIPPFTVCAECWAELQSQP